MTTSESLSILTTKINMQASLMNLQDINGVTLIDIPLANSDGRLLTGAEVYEFLQKHFGDEAIRADRAKLADMAYELGMTSGKRAAWHAYWNMANLIRTTPIGDGEK